MEAMKKTINLVGLIHLSFCLYIFFKIELNLFWELAIAFLLARDIFVLIVNNFKNRGYEIIYKKVTAWMRDNEVEYILRQNINCYLRLFFMEIAKNYYDLSKEEKSDFKDSYYNIIKTLN